MPPAKSIAMDPNAPKFIRVTAFFSGRVQGVGFRHHTCQQAEAFEVAGTVQNLSDGRVQVVVEGETLQIEQFLTRVQSPTAGHVSKVEQFRSEASHEFHRFRVIT